MIKSLLCLLFGLCSPATQLHHIYPPNIMLWPNGAYKVMSQGTRNFHGNRFMVPANAAGYVVWWERPKQRNTPFVIHLEPH